MSGAQRTRLWPSTRIQLLPKQANIFTWGWQKDDRFQKISATPRAPANTTTPTSSHSSSRRLDRINGRTA